jgi:hypothetical protein
LRRFVTFAVLCALVMTSLLLTFSDLRLYLRARLARHLLGTVASYCGRSHSRADLRSAARSALAVDRSP